MTSDHAVARSVAYVLTVATAALSVSACSSGDDRIAVPGATTAQNVAPASVATTAAPTTSAPATTAPPTTTTTTVVVTRPPTTPGPTTTATPTTPPPVDGPYYRAGDEAPEIAIIQLKLLTVGFLEPGYAEGVFDAATNGAVLEFQGQYGLVVDGVVGPQTERALTAAAVSVEADG